MYSLHITYIVSMVNIHTSTDNTTMTLYGIEVRLFAKYAEVELQSYANAYVHDSVIMYGCDVISGIGERVSNCMRIYPGCIADIGNDDEHGRYVVLLLGDRVLLKRIGDNDTVFGKTVSIYRMDTTWDTIVDYHFKPVIANGTIWLISDHYIMKIVGKNRYHCYSYNNNARKGSTQISIAPAIGISYHIEGTGKQLHSGFGFNSDGSMRLYEEGVFRVETSCLCKWDRNCIGITHYKNGVKVDMFQVIPYNFNYNDTIGEVNSFLASLPDDYSVALSAVKAYAKSSICGLAQQYTDEYAWDKLHKLFPSYNIVDPIKHLWVHSRVVIGRYNVVYGDRTAVIRYSDSSYNNIPLLMEIIVWNNTMPIRNAILDGGMLIGSRGNSTMASEMLPYPEGWTAAMVVSYMEDMLSKKDTMMDPVNNAISTMVDSFGALPNVMRVH